MYTAKWASSVKRAFCPSASRRSAQWAYASKSSRKASRSAASAGLSSVWTAMGRSSSESDEVDAGERVVNLLHLAPCCEVAEVDRGEPCVLEQRSHRGLGVGVVPGDEDHTPASGRLRIRAEHFGAERVAGLHDRCAGNKVSDELARCSPLEIVGSPVVGRVDNDLTLPLEALQGRGHSIPGHGNDGDAGRCCLFRRPCRDSL